jgi:hypothetical protein
MKTFSNLLIVLFFLFLSSAIAQSPDAKYYSGSGCQTSRSTDLVLRESSGATFNDSATTQNWICPIIYDDENFSANKYLYVQVSAFDRSSVGNISCRLYAMNFNGTTPYSTSVAGTVGFASGIQTIAFPTILTNGAAEYHIRCSVPGVQGGNRSGIFSYYVYEYVS